MKRFLPTLVFMWLLVATAVAQAPQSKPIKPVPIGTMSQLMIDVLFPASNAVFYVREGPTDEKGWMDLAYSAMVMGETANLLMAPERARDNDVWMKDAQLLLDMGLKAYAAAKKKDVAALQALNDPLYEACQSCHVHYRPGYKRRL